MRKLSNSQMYICIVLYTKPKFINFSRASLNLHTEYEPTQIYQDVEEEVASLSCYDLFSVS